MSSRGIFILAIDVYKRQLLDGTWNIAGTLFMDYRNAADCSDPVSYTHLDVYKRQKVSLLGSVLIRETNNQW